VVLAFKCQSLRAERDRKVRNRFDKRGQKQFPNQRDSDRAISFLSPARVPTEQCLEFIPRCAT